MIGELVRYAANRATHGAVENVTRKASWGGLAIFLLLAGTVFGLLVAFWMLEVRFGAPMAGAIIAVGCFVVGFICLSVPAILDWSERKPPVQPLSASETVAAVKEEVAGAVDYFGPIRVLGTAFMLGFGMAKRIKH